MWIPLRLGDPADARQEICGYAPSWGGLQFAHRAKYLGFVLGPCRGEEGWKKAILKYRQRARDWGKTGGGMLLDTVAYSVYAFSCLSFLAQLDDPPKDWSDAEMQALQALYTGPRAWAPPSALHGLPLLGFHAKLPNLQAVALAAKSRVYHFEALADGGLRVRERAAALRRTRERSDMSLGRLGQWQEWWEGAFLLRLDSAHRQLQRDGHGPRDIRSATLAHARGQRSEEADPEALERLIRRQWQRTCVRLLEPSRAADLRRFLCRRLRRWECGTPAEGLAQRAMTVLPRLAQHVAPRVLAAAIRTQWNGWCTARRFQQSAKCCFGCPRGQGEGSIEHYAECVRVAGISRAMLGLPRGETRERRLGEFLLLAETGDSEADMAILRRRALLTCGVYLTHCWQRHAHGPSGQACWNALRHSIKELLVQAPVGVWRF